MLPRLARSRCAGPARHPVPPPSAIRSTLDALPPIGPSAIDRRILAVADELFVEFEHLPIVDIIMTLNTVRREQTGSGVIRDEETVASIAATTRARLAARTEVA